MSRDFRFGLGALCLDFAHTGGEGEFKVFERLHEPADLEAWLRESSLALEGVTVRERDLRALAPLRTAIWFAARALADGRAPGGDHVAVINRYAAQPGLVPELAGGAVRWARDATIGQALSTIARDAIELFGGPFAGRIRECAGDTCGMLFVDTSRPGRRRWCDMERCGNRRKVRAYRARRAAGG